MYRKIDFKSNWYRIVLNIDNVYNIHSIIEKTAILTGLEKLQKKVLGGGGKGCVTKEKRTLKKMFLKKIPKVPTATKPRGGGKGLSVRTTKKRTFFAASFISLC